MSTQKKNLVSVIIPAYNAGEYVGEAIKSIQSQTYKDLEIIVIDDCSKDNTVDIVNEMAKKDNRINLLKNKENLGIGGNRNKGIEVAKGEYICWQDADDISLPQRIERQVEFLESHPDVGVVGGFIQFFSAHGDGATRRYAVDDSMLRATIFRYNPVAQPASMMRAECFDTVGGYDPKYRVSEDLDMLFRIGEHYQFGNVQDIVLRYRQTEGSLTASNLKAMEKATLTIRAHYSRSKAYHFGFADRLYNLAQKLSMSMPSSLRMYVFKKIRGDS